MSTSNRVTLMSARTTAHTSSFRSMPRRRSDDNTDTHRRPRKIVEAAVGREPPPPRSSGHGLGHDLGHRAWAIVLGHQCLADQPIQAETVRRARDDETSSTLETVVRATPRHTDPYH